MSYGIQGCTCPSRCGEDTCACALLGVRRWWARGRLAHGFPYHEPPMLFECNQTCACDLIWTIITNGELKHATQDPDSLEDIESSLMECDPQEKLEFREEKLFKGDSGGPLMHQMSSGRWAMIGIVSWGIRCGEPNHPGIYARVDKYLEWIVDNAQF